MSDGRRFPVLLGWLPRREREGLGPIPISIPWDTIAPHERTARDNHCGQSLDRLAQRGGLDPIEIYVVMHDKPYYSRSTGTIDMQDAIAYLRTIEHENKQD
jgi:hypothetical protein